MDFIKIWQYIILFAFLHYGISEKNFYDQDREARKDKFETVQPITATSTRMQFKSVVSTTSSVNITSKMNILLLHAIRFFIFSLKFFSKIEMLEKREQNF